MDRLSFIALLNDLGAYGSKVEINHFVAREFLMAMKNNFTDYKNNAETVLRYNNDSQYCVSGKNLFWKVLTPEGWPHTHLYEKSKQARVRYRYYSDCSLAILYYIEDFGITQFVDSKSFTWGPQGSLMD
jgi:hypothetical protein